MQGFWRLFGKGRMFGRPFFKTNPAGTINPVYLPQTTPEQYKERVDQKNAVYHKSCPIFLSCDLGGTSHEQWWPRSWKKTNFLKSCNGHLVHDYFRFGVGWYWRKNANTTVLSRLNWSQGALSFRSCRTQTGANVPCRSHNHSGKWVSSSFDWKTFRTSLYQQVPPHHRRHLPHPNNHLQGATRWGCFVFSLWSLDFLGRKWMLPSLLASGAVVLEVSHHISWTTRSPEVSIVQSHQEFRFLPGLLSCLFRLRKSWSTPQLHFASTCKLQKSCFVVSSCVSWHRSSQPRSLPPVFLAWWRALGDPIWKRIALVLSVDLWQCHSLHHCLKHCQTPSAAGSSLLGVRGKNRQQCLPLNLPPRHRRIRTVSGSDHFVPRHNSWILRNSNLSQLRALLAGRQRTFQRQIQHGC